MRWYNHELDDEPSPEPYDECPDGWDKSQLLLMLLVQRRGQEAGDTRDLEPIADWLIPEDAIQRVLTPSQQPRRPNKNMDFSPVMMPSSGVNHEPI